MYQKDNRKKIVFFGTPSVAALVLKELVEKAAGISKIVLVVTQPPSRSSRSQKDIPTPVHMLALEKGIPVLTPQSAKEEEFLNDLSSLEPDLCITAAYGNYLPKRFLSIPKFGTVNIHPSLLPLCAAPVQRCIQNGDKVTGVTLLHTVSQMDAGPILFQEKYDLNNFIKSEELLNILFKMGSHLLIKNLRSILQNDVVKIDQNEDEATHASKIDISESVLDFTQTALSLHNKVRAFSSWPCTRVKFKIDSQCVECKLITTEVEENLNSLKTNEILLNKESIDICCGDNKILKILEIQPTGKKVMLAKDFQNGIRVRPISLFHM